MAELLWLGRVIEEVILPSRLANLMGLAEEEERAQLVLILDQQAPGDISLVQVGMDFLFLGFLNLMVHLDRPPADGLQVAAPVLGAAAVLLHMPWVARAEEVVMDQLLQLA
jgi:hypothetical protein